MNGLNEQPFDTYASYQEAVMATIERAQSSLVIFDPDLAQTGLERRTAIDALTRLANLSTRADAIRILLRNADHVRRNAPQLQRFVSAFAHRVQLRCVSDERTLLERCFMVADGQWLVVRFHSDRPRGKFTGNIEGDAAQHLAQFETIWINAKELHLSVSTGR
jgi:hypothetical protein